MKAFEHPLVDYVEGTYVCVESAASTIYFSEALTDLCEKATAAGLVPVILSRPYARWTFATHYYAAVYGAAILIRDKDWVLDPITGFQGYSVTEVIEGAATRTRETLLFPGDFPTMETRIGVVSITVHHHLSHDVQLGRIPEIVAEMMDGYELEAWGVHEPMTLAWDRHRAQEYMRTHMPESRIMLSARTGSFSGIEYAARTRSGVMERFSALAPFSFNDEGMETVARRGVELLNAVAEALPMPMLGSVTVTQGQLDGMAGALGWPIGAPAAVLVGPRATHALNVDTHKLAEDFDVRTAGRVKLPSLIVGFGRDDMNPWEQAEQLARSFGPEALRRTMPEGGA